MKVMKTLHKMNQRPRLKTISTPLRTPVTTTRVRRYVLTDRTGSGQCWGPKWSVGQVHLSNATRPLRRPARSRNPWQTDCTASSLYSCAVLAFYSRLCSASSWGPGLVGSYDIRPGQQSGPTVTFSRVPHGDQSV